MRHLVVENIYIYRCISRCYCVIESDRNLGKVNPRKTEEILGEGCEGLDGGKYLEVLVVKLVLTLIMFAVNVNLVSHGLKYLVEGRESVGMRSWKMNFKGNSILNRKDGMIERF